MKVYRIAAIPGDGIGKEVVPAGQKVLEVLASIGKSFGFEFENFDWGGDYYRTHGVMMPDDGLEGVDAVASRVDPRRRLKQRDTDDHPKRHLSHAALDTAARQTVGRRSCGHPATRGFARHCRSFGR